MDLGKRDYSDGRCSMCAVNPDEEQSLILINLEKCVTTKLMNKLPKIEDKNHILLRSIHRVEQA